MYSIQCPLISAPTTLVNLGALERSLALALNNFSNQGNGLAVPLISDDWERAGGMPLSSSNASGVISALRRLSDAGEMLTDYYREIEMKDKNAASSKSSQHSFDIHQTNQTRLKEMTAPLRKSDSQVAALKARWRLALRDSHQGFAFVNDDGRAIHVRSVSGVNAVFGYGWVNSIMHYLDIDAKHELGRSVALFERRDAHTTDFSVTWFTGLVEYLLNFLSLSRAQGTPLLVTGTGIRQQEVKWEGLASDDQALTKCFRSLNFGKDFSLETKTTVDGTRNPMFGYTPIAQASAHYRAGNDYVTIGMYRPDRDTHISENGLTTDQKDRLRFPRPPTPPPPRPSRPSRFP